MPHGIRKYFELGKRQRTPADIVPFRRAFHANDVHPKLRKPLHVRHQRVPFHTDPLVEKRRYDLCNRGRMLFVRVLPQVFQNI